MHMVLRTGRDAEEIAGAAWERGVAVATLARYFAGPVTVNGLVLGYGGASSGEITRACQLLAGLPPTRRPAAHDQPCLARACQYGSPGMGADAPARRLLCWRGRQCFGNHAGQVRVADADRTYRRRLMAEGGVPGVEDVARLGSWLADNGIPAGDGPPRGPAHRRRAVQPDLPARCRARPRPADPAPPAARPRAADRARHGQGVPGTHRPERHGGPGAPPGRALPGHLGRRCAVLPDGVRGRGGAADQRGRGRLAPGQAGQLSQRFVEMLAASTGWTSGAVGLAGFGKPEGYLDRQLARWQRQWELSVTREMPGYDDLTRRLAAGLPAGHRRGTAGRSSCTGTTGSTTC